MKELLPKFSFFIFFVSLCNLIQAQSCGSCSVHISGADSSSYIVGPGQILCIDSLGEFSGTLTVTGGTVCNRGFLRPDVMQLSSGSVNNKALFSFDGAITLDSSFVLNNEYTGILSFGSHLTINNASFNNSGIVTLGQDLTFQSGTLTNNSILNCRYLLGAAVPTLINSGIINKDDL